MNRLLLALIVLAYLIIGALYAIKTPDWQVPDEPAHYNYIHQLAEGGRFPVLEMGDYDQDYLGRLTSERFPPELPVENVQYEDHQPPLYYLLATPVYLAFDGGLTALRLLSVVIGAGVVLLAYAVAAAVFPERPLIALGTAAFVAFLPQHVAMMAGVNNDGLTELLIGLTLWMVVRPLPLSATVGGTGDGARESTNKRRLAWLGVVLGLGLVTKTTFVPVAMAVTVALLVRWWREGERAWGVLVRSLGLVFGPALLVAVPWWLRNMSLYGGLDIYGLVNHDTIVVGQPRTADWIRDQGLGAWLERGITFTFQSFWGQFGWMGVLMPTWLYRALAVGVGGLVLGFLTWLRRAAAATQHTFPTAEGRGLKTRNTQYVILVTTVLFVVLAYLTYNRTFVQHQGRYLFPALIPIALGVVLAVEALVRLLRLPVRLHPLAHTLVAMPYLALAALDLYALWRLIVPALT